jgi:hypothetical protein
MMRSVIWLVLIDVSGVCCLLLLIVLTTEAVNTSEASGNTYQTTWCNNPEDIYLTSAYVYSLGADGKRS